MTEQNQHDEAARDEAAHDKAVETSRAGGDAPAAGTVGEREAVARDDDHLFGDDHGDEDEDSSG